MSHIRASSPTIVLRFVLKHIVDEFYSSFHQYESLNLVNLINRGDFPRKTGLFDAPGTFQGF